MRPTSLLGLVLLSSASACKSKSKSACEELPSCHWYGEKYGCFMYKGSGTNVASAPPPDANTTVSDSTVPGVYTKRSMPFGGTTRTYYVYVPKSGGIQGLMLFFHGAGQSAELSSPCDRSPCHRFLIALHPRHSLALSPPSPQA